MIDTTGKHYWEFTNIRYSKFDKIDSKQWRDEFNILSSSKLFKSETSRQYILPEFKIALKSLTLVKGSISFDRIQKNLGQKERNCNWRFEEINF